MSEGSTDWIGPRRPWVFLILWEVGQAILAFLMVAQQAVSNYDIMGWARTPQGLFVGSVLGSAVGLAILFAMHRPRIPTGFLELFSLRPSLKEIRFIWLFIGIVIGVSSCVHPKTWHLGNAFVDHAIFVGRTQGGLAYVIIAVVLLGPIGEELILRGYLYQAFRLSHGKAIGTAIMVAISILLHEWSLYGSFVHGIMAALFCWSFESRHNLLDSMLFHVAYNATSIVCPILIH